MSTIIQDVLFPILCYSSEDHELWLADPIEYIHLKFGKIFCRVTAKPGTCRADPIGLLVRRILAISAQPISSLLDMKNTDFFNSYNCEKYVFLKI